MEIPVNAKVHCTDGFCGHSTCLIVNPATEQITHVVVKARRAPHREHLVPVKWITTTTEEAIHLRCTREELATADSFVEHEFPKIEIPRYRGTEYVAWPFVVPEERWMDVEHKRIPLGELAVRRGIRVEAYDGEVGQVDEFLVDPADGYITHLVLREEHLWGQKDVLIPVSEIGRIDEDRIYLKLSKEEIAELPTIPVRR
jgi:uncharacterized protein YrrD